MKKLAMILLWAGIFCVFCFNYGYAFYQWEDENGVVHFGDAPPDGASGVEEMKETQPPKEVKPSGIMENVPAKMVAGEVKSTTKQELEAPEDAITVLGKYLLDPHSKELITFNAFEATTVGFKTDLTTETSGKCQNFCVGLKDKNSGDEIQSPYGGSIELKPISGFIEVYVGNFEDFPVQVIVYTK